MRLRSADWRLLALWVAGFALACFCLAWVVRAEGERELRRAAQQSGLRWVRQASSTVPRLDAVFSGTGIAPAAREQLQRLSRADGIFRIALFNPSGRLMYASDGLDRPGDAPTAPAAAESGAPGSLEGARAFILDKALAGQVHTELSHRGQRERPERPAIYSEAYVPVLLGGKLIGVADVYLDQTESAASINGAFSRIAGAVLLVLLSMLGVAGYQLWLRLRQQRGAQARVRYMAHHDALSGALNRASFTEVLEKAAWRRAEGGPSFSLLCIDLDHFKEVNDSLGHAAGDEVLRLATQRLKDAVREGDKVARLGGDEFAILLPGVASVEAVTPLAQRVVQALAQPYDVQDQRVRCGGSVGIAIHGLDATDPDDLLGKADLALYRAKADGRGTFSFYDVAMDRQMQARRELTRDLREAIAGDQLALHYQPLYGNDGLTLTGYEALLRWQHPRLGNVPPVEFIPLAEETGLIDSIGQWVLKRACLDAAAWPDPLTVAVNLSAAQFTSGDLVGAVTQALAEAGLDARRLELEITESLLMHNTDEVLATLRALADMGVPIAMDDFGTGYSSLAYLKRFSASIIKIDQTFIRDIAIDSDDAAIAAAIIIMAHSLRLRVIAEGVETAEQLTFLREQGCDEAQGYLLARPMPAEACAQVLRTRLQLVLPGDLRHAL